MSSIAEMNDLLQAEITRVGGGYLKIATDGSDARCRLFVHEGSELGITPRGTVYWHPWDGDKFVKNELLDLLQKWPTFAHRELDDRVGIWFDEYRHQTNRKTGAVRWKEIGRGDAFYPELFPWDELETLSP